MNRVRQPVHRPLQGERIAVTECDRTSSRCVHVCRKQTSTISEIRANPSAALASRTTIFREKNQLICAVKGIERLLTGVRVVVKPQITVDRKERCQAADEQKPPVSSPGLAYWRFTDVHAGSGQPEQTQGMCQHDNRRQRYSDEPLPTIPWPKIARAKKRKAPVTVII